MIYFIAYKWPVRTQKLWFEENIPHGLKNTFLYYKRKLDLV